MWTVVSQRAAQRCTRQGLLAYQHPPVSLRVWSPSLSWTIMELVLRIAMARAPCDCSWGDPSTLPLSLVFRYCYHWCGELHSYVEQGYILLMLHPTLYCLRLDALLMCYYTRCWHVLRNVTRRSNNCKWVALFGICTMRSSYGKAGGAHSSISEVRWKW